MRKTFLILIVLCAMAVSFSAVFAQAEELMGFIGLFHADHFDQDSVWEYYRFPTLVPFFDPLDLSYFPHETWKQTDWSLLGRRQNSGTYQQLIMLDEPAETWIFHGTPIPKDRGFLGDFYMYATLFITDSYPDDKGTCYLYYSDSLLQGFSVSHGILIDPLTGIYKVENSYETSYNLTNKSHELTIVKAIHPEDFPLPEFDFSTSSMGGWLFPNDQSGIYFLSDLSKIKSQPHMPGSSVKAFCIELLRIGTDLKVYINGKFAAEIDDGITVPAGEGETGPADKVSWSYGPLLYDGGVTVTCSAGDVVLRTSGK